MNFINLATGQVYDLTTDQGIIDAYFDVKTLKGQIKKMDEQLNQFLTEKVGELESVKVSAFTLRPTTRVVTEYPISALRQVFDEDQLMECMKPQTTKVKEMMNILGKEEKCWLLARANVNIQTLPPKLI